MARILLIFALIAGAAIPLFDQNRQFYYVFAFAVLAILVAGRRHRITVHDLLALFIILIPFQHFRLGTENLFLRLTELAFIPLFFLWLAQETIRGGGLAAKRLPHEYIALALFIGVLVGTYSSIFVASPLVYIWRKRAA